MKRLAMVGGRAPRPILPARGIRLVGPFMYDLETFTRVAEPAGFEVRQVDYGQSEHPEFRVLDLRKPDETMSIYLELWPATGE